MDSQIMKMVKHSYLLTRPGLYNDPTAHQAARDNDGKPSSVSISDIKTQRRL